MYESGTLFLSMRRDKLQVFFFFFYLTYYGFHIRLGTSSGRNAPLERLYSICRSIDLFSTGIKYARIGAINFSSYSYYMWLRILSLYVLYIYANSTKVLHTSTEKHVFVILMKFRSICFVIFLYYEAINSVRKFKVKNDH